jgi:hypothetical protein
MTPTPLIEDRVRRVLDDLENGVMELLRETGLIE